MRKLGSGIIGRVGALAISVVAIVGCGDNGVVPIDAAPPIDMAEIDAPQLPTISDVPDQTIDEDGTTGSLGFTVADPMGGTSGLTVTATSNNTAVIPDANVVLGGSGGNRTVTVTPAANQFGSSTITLTVMAGTLEASSSFTVTVTSVNDVPTITAIADATVQTGTATNALTFTIGDVETPAASLTLSGSSDNTTLVPNGGIVFGGSGAARTVTVTPAASGTGTANITVTVNDANGGTGQDTFTVTVRAPTLANNPPVNQVPGAQTTNEDVPLVFGAGNVIAISDIDAGTASVQVSLGTTIGTLSLSGTSGLTFSLGDGTADANMTFTGSINSINTALNGLTLATAMNASGTGTLTITTNDQGNTGTGGPLSDTDTVAITVNAVNDLPTITTIADQTINEDTATGLLAFMIGDIETAAAALNVTATSSNQVLVPNGALVLAGTGANRTIVATPAANEFGSTIITLTVTDGNGGTAQSQFTLNVTGLNDGPTIQNVANQSMNLGDTLPVNFTIFDLETPASMLNVTASSDNLGVSGTPVLSGTGSPRTVTLTPTSNGTATITLTVSDGFLTASDTFVLTVNNFNDPPVLTVPGTQNYSVITTGTATQRTLNFSTLNAVSVSDPDAGANNIDISFAVNTGGTMAVNATAGVTITGNNTANLTLSGPQVNVRTALGTLRYIANTSFFGQSIISVSTSDNGNSGTPFTVLTASGSITVNVNAAPTISGLAPTITVAEDGTGSTTFQVADDDGTVANIVTTATSSRPSLVGNPTVTGSGAVRTITLTPLPNQNSVSAGGNAVITVTATDALNGAVVATFSFVVTQVNDAPQITVPGAQQVGNEDGAITLTGLNRIRFTDVDQGASENPNGPFQVQLSVTQGTMTLASLAGLAFSTGTGSNDTTMTFVGNFTNVHNALDGMTLRLGPNQFTTSAGTLTVTVNDQANGGAPAAADTDSISYVFNPVNDGPTHSNESGIATLTTNTTRTGLNVDVADIDAAGNSLTVTLNSAQGTMTLASTAGLTFTTGDGVGDATIIFSGDLTSINNALGGFSFTPNLNFAGDARIEVTTNDNGNVGSGGQLTVTSNIFTTFTAIANTAPTITTVANQTIVEDTPTGALAFTIADGQTTPDNLSVSVSGGSLSTMTASLGGSGANRTITVTPDLNYAGAPVSFTITVSDGLAFATTTFTVTVTPVNDAPTLAPIADITVAEDAATLTVSFTVGDVDSLLNSGSLAVSTNNPALLDVNQASITLVGSPCAAPCSSTGSVQISFPANDSGNGNVTVSVSDGTLTAQRTFRITVTPVNDPPSVTSSGQIQVDDIEQTVLRVKLSLPPGEIMSLGTTTGITFVDVGTASTNAPDGNADGDGVNDQVMGIQGTITNLNLAMDDLVTSGGLLNIRVDDLTGSATVADYAAGSGIATATRNLGGPFGPNPIGALVLRFTSNSLSATYPATSLALTTSLTPTASLDIGGGFFDSDQPGTSDTGQWLPGLTPSDATLATEVTAGLTARGWLLDQDLAGRTLNPGLWTFRINVNATVGAGEFGRMAVRVTVVTAAGGVLTPVDTLTGTNPPPPPFICGPGIRNGAAVFGWQSHCGENQISIGANDTETVSIQAVSGHIFATGERLFIELGFNDASNTNARAWHAIVGGADPTRIVTADFN